MVKNELEVLLDILRTIQENPKKVDKKDFLRCLQLVQEFWVDSHIDYKRLRKLFLSM